MPQNRVTSTDFKNNVGKFQDAAQSRPVIITKQGRDHTVMISADEYQRLKSRDRRAVRIDDLDDDQLAKLADAEVPEEYGYLDDLLEPDKS